jgi:Uma2 family endonuclease
MELSSHTEGGLATAEDLVELEHHEIIKGVLVRKASPAVGHAYIHGELLVQLGAQGVWRGGGWRFFIEPILELTDQHVYLPDIAGWRIETMPEQPEPTQAKISVRPDWVCEILSPSTARNDLTVKRAHYCAAGVGHYWVIDPRDQVVIVLRNNGRVFEIAETATIDDADTALEPFSGCVLNLRLLFAMEAASRATSDTP